MADDYKTKDKLRQAVLERHEVMLSQMSTGYALHELIFDDEGTAVDYRFLEVNPAFERLTGLKRADIIGKTVMEILPGTEKYWIDEYAKVVHSGETAKINQFSQQIDRYFEVTAFSPTPNQFITLFNDVTEYKKNMRKLRGQTVAIEQSMDGVCLANLDGEVVFVNEAWAKLHEFSREELLGKPISLFHTMEQMETEVGPIFQHTKVNGFHKGVVNHVTKTGRIFLTRMSSTLVHDDDGNPLGIIGIAHDISEERKLEEELRQAQKMEAVGTLAGGIAHEFNNILYVIFGFADLIESSLEPGHESSEYVAELLKAAERARNLVARIVTFSNQEVGDIKLFSIESELADVLALLKPTTRASIQIEEKVEATRELVWGDPVRFKQALLNICTNATQAMEQGGVLAVSLTKCSFPEKKDLDEDLEPGEYLKLSVSDSGKGMDKETKSRIFDPFFTTKDVGVGHGLGLSAVHGIINSMKGTIEVDSALGEGTVFTIYLPIQQRKKKVERIVNGPLGGTERLLLVDDEELIIQAIGRRLRKLGYEVRAERSSIKALEYFQSAEETVDLVITDLTMPKMSGLELVEELRKLNDTVPVVLCTGYGEAAIQESAKELGCAVVMKPVAVKELSATIRKLLDENKE